MGPLAYDAVVWAEYAGWLPFAPDAPDLAALGHPPIAHTLMATIFITVFVPASTAIVTALVRAVQRREAALVVANERLEQLSQLDPLTNLYNRRHLFARIEAELARVRRGHPLALVMIDLDHFKKVNDTQGHLRGDVLLKEIAAALGRDDADDGRRGPLRRRRVRRRPARHGRRGGACGRRARRAGRSRRGAAVRRGAAGDRERGHRAGSAHRTRWPRCSAAPTRTPTARRRAAAIAWRREPAV